MKKEFLSKFFPIILLVFCALNTVASANQYPRYMGVDCSAEGYGEFGLTGIPEVDQYCAHIVCEAPDYCIPYHYPAYDIPVLDYRDVKVVTGYGNGLLLRTDGGAISWGDHLGLLEKRQDIRNQLKSDVAEIYGSDSAFAVLKNDGALLTWTSGETYGEIDSDFFIANIATELASGIDRIFSSPAGFVAFTKDNSVVSWGDGRDENNNRTQGHRVPGLNADDVADIFMNVGGETVLGTGNGSITKGGAAAFAALKKDGSVVVWGDERSGGKIGTKREGLANIVKIASTKSAFAALRENGSVTAWGNSYHGGSLLIVNPFQTTKSTPVNQALQSDVTEIYSNDMAFAALKSDGSVVTWGSSYQGGDSSTISNFLNNVVEIIPSYNGFAALRNDGIVVSWGEWLEPPYDTAPIHADVKKVVGNGVGAYAALKNDGSVVTWGNMLDRGRDLQSGVVDIHADHDSFAALKADGSVVSWGDRFNENGIYEKYRQNGDLGAKDETDPKRIKTITSYPLHSGFFAVRNDGSFISWGVAAYVDHSYDDDPVWSRIWSNGHYAWYFGLEAKKRESSRINHARPLFFSLPPKLTHQGGLVERDFNEWAEFDALPGVDDNGVNIIWRFKVEGFQSDGSTPKNDVCLLWSNHPYSATHRRVVSGLSADPGDICRVSAVGEATAPYYSPYNTVPSVDLIIAPEKDLSTVPNPVLFPRSPSSGNL